MTAIGELLCGKTSPSGIAGTALNQLRTSLDDFYVRALGYLNLTDDDALCYGPFCARVLLENGCAALVGRIDPFRLMYISEFQAQPTYEFGKRSLSAFGWSGDVMPDVRRSEELWKFDQDPTKISRALFSPHLDHICWKPAFNHLLDFLNTNPADPIMDEIVAIDPENFIPQVRGRAAQLYSTLSKGVHWEFFSGMIFDEATVKTSIRDTLLLVGNLALTSHFLSTAQCAMTPEAAVAAYLVFRGELP